MQKEITPLRALRCNRVPPLTLAALASVLGFSEPTLSVVERGIRGAGDSLISRLALFYGMKPEVMRRLAEKTYNPKLRSNPCPKPPTRNRKRRK